MLTRGAWRRGARATPLLLALAGCLATVEERAPRDGGTTAVDAGTTPLDGGHGVDAGARTDAGLDAGGGVAPRDAGPGDPDSGIPWQCSQPGWPPISTWCLNAPGDLRGCNEATLLQCAGLGGSILVEDGLILWLDEYDSLWLLPTQGGPARRLARGMGGFIALKGGFAYWFDRNPATIHRTPVDGGPAETLATHPGGFAWLAVTATHLYWVDTSPPSAETDILRMPLDGGPAELLYPGERVVEGLTLDDSFLYWGTLNSGEIRRGPLAGGTPITLFSGTPSPVMLKLAGGYVYWAETGFDTHFRRGPLDGGAAETLALNQNSQQFVIDGDTFYALVQGVGLFRFPVAGGPSETLLSAPQMYGLLAMDRDRFYLSFPGGLWSLPR